MRPRLVYLGEESFPVLKAVFDLMDIEHHDYFFVVFKDEQLLHIVQNLYFRQIFLPAV